MTTLESAPEVSDLLDQFAGRINSPSADLALVRAELDRLGLLPYAAEIEAQGFTVIPPEKVAPPEFIERLRTAVLDVYERRTGIRPDIDGADTQGGTPFGQMQSYLLFEDPAFQEAVLNPSALAMADYLVGRSSMLFVMQAYLKGPGGAELALHTDNVMMPSPYPPYAQVCNTSWLLTDYSLENGSIAFVPGSHRFGRPPEPGEGMEERVHVDAPAGSLLVWPGSTWHGAFARRVPGIRMVMPTMYSRMYLTPQEPFGTDAPDELVERLGPRFAALMGRRHPYGYRAENIDFTKVAVLPGRSWWD